MSNLMSDKIKFVIYLANGNLATLNFYKLSKLNSSRYFRNMPERQLRLSITPFTIWLNFPVTFTKFANLLGMSDAPFRLYIYTYCYG